MFPIPESKYDEELNEKDAEAKGAKGANLEAAQDDKPKEQKLMTS